MPKPKTGAIVALITIMVVGCLIVSACARYDVATTEEELSYTWAVDNADYYLGHFAPQKAEFRTDSNTYVLENYDPEEPEDGYIYLKFLGFRGTKEGEKYEEYILKYKPTSSKGPYLRYNTRQQTIEPCGFEIVK